MENREKNKNNSIEAYDVEAKVLENKDRDSNKQILKLKFLREELEIFKNTLKSFEDNISDKNISDFPVEPWMTDFNEKKAIPEIKDKIKKLEKEIESIIKNN